MFTKIDSISKTSQWQGQKRGRLFYINRDLRGTAIKVWMSPGSSFEQTTIKKIFLNNGEIFILDCTLDDIKNILSVIKL